MHKQNIRPESEICKWSIISIWVNRYYT